MLKDALDYIFQHCLQSCIGVGVATPPEAESIFPVVSLNKRKVCPFSTSVALKNLFLQCPQEVCVCVCLCWGGGGINHCSVFL